MKKLITKITAGVLSLLMLTTPVMTCDASEYRNDDVDYTYGIAKDIHYAATEKMNFDNKNEIYRFGNHSYRIDSDRPDTTNLYSWKSILKDLGDQKGYVEVKTTTVDQVDKIKMEVTLEYYDEAGFPVVVDEWTFTDYDTDSFEKCFTVKNLDKDKKYRINTIHQCFVDGESTDVQLSKTKWLKFK